MDLQDLNTDRSRGDSREDALCKQRCEDCTKNIPGRGIKDRISKVRPDAGNGAAYLCLPLVFACLSACLLDHAHSATQQ